MRSIILTYLLSIHLCSFAQNNKKFITAYTDDFSGLHYDFGIGRYDNLYLLQTGFPKIQSIRVPAGLKVSLYPQDNFQGTPVTVTEDAYKRFLVAKGFGETGQSFSMVVAEYNAPPNSKVITLYQDNFSGASKNLTAGRFESYEFGAIDNDQVSSVKIPKGMKVTLYQNSGYSGKSIVLTKDASSDFLTTNHFNNTASSILVEEEPEVVAPSTVQKTEQQMQPPTVIVLVQEKKENPQEQIKEEEINSSNPKCRIYQGNFSGTSQVLAPGKYDAKTLAIGDNELSSIKIIDGLKVTLYELEGFRGKSLVLTEDADAAFLDSKQFNNMASSIVVEFIPRATVYQDNFTGDAFSFGPGMYNMNSLKLDNDQISSVKVSPGIWVLLFEDMNYAGKSLLLTEDASTEYLSKFKFNNQASSMMVGTGEDPLPQVTIYADDFYGASQKLTPGKYTYMDMGIGNNTLSSIHVSRGLRVTLFESDRFDGASVQLRQSVGADFMKGKSFNDMTSSLLIEVIRPEDLYVTIYSDAFKGASQNLTAGKYKSSDLTIGARQLSSIRVPDGFEVTLFEKDNFGGFNSTLTRDKDFTGSRLFDNAFSSLIVEEKFDPIVTGVSTAVVIEEKTQPQEQQEPKVIVPTAPPCNFTGGDFNTAVKAIDSKPFSEERMAMAKLVTKGKCLTNDQVRTIAKMFGFDEQSLEFVKYAYELASEKDTYYTLEDVFRFNSVRESFTKFLSEK
jgi:hypothetical protein